MTTVTSKDGTTIVFDQSGSGPVVILVGGALSDRSSMGQLAELLAPHFTVINYDRRGRGDSNDTPPYAVEREIEDIEAVIDAEGGSAFVFGTSSGAALVLEAANKLPTKIKKAVLHEPPYIIDDTRPPLPKDYVPHLEKLAAENRRAEAVEYFMTVGVGVPAEVVTMMKESPMWAGMESTAHTLSYDGIIMGDRMQGKPLPRDQWGAASMPTLVLDGSESPPSLRNPAQSLAELLPNAQYRTLDGQDHAVPVMAPHALAPVLVDFFGS